jgi:hypothetical protein
MMVNDVQHKLLPVMAQRKKKLVAQGAIYRLGVIESRNAVQANLHADTLAKGALDHLMASVPGAFSNAFGNATGLKNFTLADAKALLPFLISTVSLLSRKKALLKLVIVGAVALTAAGAVAFFVSKKKPAES